MRGEGRNVTRLGPLAALAAAGVVLAGCGLADDGDNLVNGKQLFVQKCAACHTLERAGATGVSGPNLDAALVQARKDGFGESTFKGMVEEQILNPSKSAQVDPATGKSTPGMPADIVTGEDASDVAAYVAMAAGAGGEDQGRLASIGAAKAEGVARARGGELEIPADPGGALAFEFASAQAPPGRLTIRSLNESSVDHDISLEGNGVDEVGEVVRNGGVSEIRVNLKPGEYTFYCSVPGHREGGMEGTLTVE